MPAFFNLAFVIFGEGEKCFVKITRKFCRPLWRFAKNDFQNRFLRWKDTINSRPQVCHSNALWMGFPQFQMWKMWKTFCRKRAHFSEISRWKSWIWRVFHILSVDAVDVGSVFSKLTFSVFWVKILHFYPFVIFFFHKFLPLFFWCHFFAETTNKIFNITSFEVFYAQIL